MVLHTKRQPFQRISFILKLINSKWNRERCDGLIMHVCCYLIITSSLFGPFLPTTWCAGCNPSAWCVSHTLIGSNLKLKGEKQEQRRMEKRKRQRERQFLCPEFLWWLVPNNLPSSSYMPPPLQQRRWNVLWSSRIKDFAKTSAERSGLSTERGREWCGGGKKRLSIFAFHRETVLSAVPPASPPSVPPARWHCSLRACQWTECQHHPREVTKRTANKLKDERYIFNGGKSFIRN